MPGAMDEDRRVLEQRGRRGPTSWAIAALGIFLILLGIPQIVGGIWLLASGGSWYYLPAGLALSLSGYLLARQRALGAWIYDGLFAATVVWSLWESGMNGWGLLPRLFGYLILFLLVNLSLPRLVPSPRTQWLRSAAFAVFG